MKAWLCLLLFTLPLAAQHGRYTSESTNPAIGDPVAIAAGGKLYLQSCAGCHGPDGSGGRGPTKDMSPTRMFQSCGSSSSRQRRKIRPSGVTLAAMWPPLTDGPSAEGVIVRNFHMTKPRRGVAMRSAP